MGNALSPFNRPVNQVAVSPQRVRQYVNQSKAPNTQRAYRAQWNDFTSFCEAHGHVAMPASAETVIDYMTTCADAGRRASTMQVKLAAIGFMHDAAKQPNPAKSIEVRTVMSGIRRTIGTAPQRKAPVTLEGLRQIVGALGDDLRGRRDRALILIGFAGAFRRSELVALDVADVRMDATRATILLRKSKTDQEGAGFVKVIPELADPDGIRPDLCPVRALKAWLDTAGLQSGPLFRGIDRWGHVHGRMDGREVARIVKGAAELAGVDARQFGGHSLRAGFVTQAAVDGVPAWAIAEVTGHKSQQVLAGYIRAAGRGQIDAIRAVFGEAGPA